MVICLGCLLEFNPKRKDQRFCNTECYLKSDYKREYNRQNCKNHYHYKGGKELRTWRHKRRQHWINKYKIARGCDGCDWNEHWVALDFDHIEPYKKKFNISRAVRDLQYTIKDLFEEIRKCRLLCVRCHRLKTHNENLYYKKRLNDTTH